MKITRQHYEFWCQRKAKVSWYTPTDKNIRGNGTKPVSIHALIPVEIKVDRDFTVNNLLVNLRYKRNRGEDLAEYLQKQAFNPGTIINPKKVSSLCMKWAMRIIAERLRRMEKWVKEQREEL